MKMFKRILAVTMVAALTLALFAACGPKPNNGNKISTLEEEKGKALKILIPGEATQPWQEAVFAEFRTKYPDVTLEVATASWTEWEIKMSSAYNAKDPYDVVNIGVNSMPKLSLMGLVQPIQHYVNMQNPNLHMTTMEDCFKYNGNYYVAATDTNFGIIFYNKDMFADAGLTDPMQLYRAGKWNWSEFVRAAKTLTDKDNNVTGYATNEPYLFYGSNATSTLKLDANGKFALNMDDPAFIAALEILQDGEESGWSGYQGHPTTTFAYSYAAMLGIFTMYEPSVRAYISSAGVSLNYGAVPLPAGPNNPNKQNMVHAEGYAIGAGADCPAHAGKLIDMLADAQAAHEVELNKDIPAEHVALYNEMRNNVFCVNTRDSAVGGGYDLVNEVKAGKSIAQVIEAFKPQYQSMIDKVNGR